MGRQDRRREMRQGDKPFAWDKIVVSLVLVFFAGTALVSYLFPVINQKSYAAGSARVQKIIISRAMADLNKKTALEFMFTAISENNDTIQFKVNEQGSKITLTDTKEDISSEYTATTVPAPYLTVGATLEALSTVLKSKDFKVIYQEGEHAGYSILRVVNAEKSGDVIEGYDLYFTQQHSLDIVHHYRRVGDEAYIQRIYSGLITGVTPD